MTIHKISANSSVWSFFAIWNVERRVSRKNGEYALDYIFWSVRIWPQFLNLLWRHAVNGRLFRYFLQKNLCPSSSVSNDVFTLRIWVGAKALSWKIASELPFGWFRHFQRWDGPKWFFVDLHSRIAISEKLRNTPQIIFSDLLESALNLKIRSIYKVFRERCLRRKNVQKIMFPENGMKCSFDSVDQNFQTNCRKPPSFSL